MICLACYSLPNNPFYKQVHNFRALFIVREFGLVIAHRVTSLVFTSAYQAGQDTRPLAALPSSNKCSLCPSLPSMIFQRVRLEPNEEDGGHLKVWNIQARSGKALNIM